MRVRPSRFVPLSSGSVWALVLCWCLVGGVALTVIRPAWWPLSALYVLLGSGGLLVERRARHRQREQIRDERARLKVVRSRLRADFERRGRKVKPMLIDEDVW